MKSNRQISRQVGLIYNWLDEHLNNSDAKGNCAACGNCCDFEKFGHKLFVTTPEIMYFKCSVEKLNCHSDRSDAKRCAAEESIKTDSSTSLRPARAGLRCARNDKFGRCCYQVDGKCTVYPYRFAGCRIFSCKGNADFQSDLTEAVIKKFKALCEKYRIPYRYVELPVALKDFLTTEGTKIHRDNIEF